MRVQRSLQLVTILTTLATVAACGSYGGGPRDHADPNYSSSVAVSWDSGPLDQDYHRQRVDMDARHNQEVASPRSDESSDQRVQRQAHENSDLEARYTQGKASHAQSVPPADRQ